MTNVFISYSKRRDLTFRLRDYLKSKGLEVWVDQDALEARGEFDGQIRAGLQQAKVIVSKLVIEEATYCTRSSWSASSNTDRRLKAVYTCVTRRPTGRASIYYK